MAKAFSKREEIRLLSCDIALQRIVRRVHLERMTLIVVCGHRGEAAQNAAFKDKASKLKWPHSRHNVFPSEAVDLAPFPLDWKDLGRFAQMADHMLEIAHDEGVTLIWGGSWPKFQDFGHFEMEKDLGGAAA